MKVLIGIREDLAKSVGIQGFNLFVHFAPYFFRGLLFHNAGHDSFSSERPLGLDACAIYVWSRVVHSTGR
jgi:hypothetical protein